MTTNVKAFLTDVNRDGFHEVAEAILASGGKDAEHISYDNTESGLEAENVQAAIDEVAGDVSDIAGDVSQLGTTVNGLYNDVLDLDTTVSGLSGDIDALETTVSGKVSKSGDTMSGNLNIDLQNGTTLSVASSSLTLGNDKAEGTDKNSRGALIIYGKTTKKAYIYDENGLTADRYLYLPNNSGTLALTSDIYLTSFQQIVSVTANTTLDTTLDFAGNNIDTSKILNVTVTWNNPSNDVPTFMVYYSNNGYINRIQHRWNVSQNVKLIINVLLKK